MIQYLYYMRIIKIYEGYDDMKDTWNDWWEDFLERKRLRNIVAELNELDSQLGRENLTEKICKAIYDGYDGRDIELQKVKKALSELLGDLDEVHLQSSRIKKKASLIEKVIRKRYENILSETSDYANLDDQNYAGIITDLVGIRLIVNYRGKWQDIHRKILEYFPIRALEEYQGVEHLPHMAGEQFLAEIPIAYYAEGDDLSQYKAMNLKVKLHKMGYRSVHYIISCQNVYTELQVRTIYDEAWSDCDHNYVYKQDANPNNRALKLLSQILCNLTNIANDIGENMHDIFQGDGLSDINGEKWVASGEVIEFYRSILKRLHGTETQLERFNSLLEGKKEDEKDDRSS